MLNRGLARRTTLLSRLARQHLLVPRVEPAGVAVGTDGPSGVYVPASAADWTLLGLPAPIGLWLCQEASGNLADSIGAATLTANATPLYAQTVPGWTRTFIGFQTGTASQRFHTTAAALDFAAGQSAAWLQYSSYAAPASATRYLATINAASNRVAVTINGYISTVHNGTAATSSTNTANIATVRPVLWYRNATTNASGTMTDAEHLVGTHDESAFAGQSKGPGAVGANTVTESRTCLIACWTGADAETIAAKATLQTLGWTIPW